MDKIELSYLLTCCYYVCQWEKAEILTNTKYTFKSQD